MTICHRYHVLCSFGFNLMKIGVVRRSLEDTFTTSSLWWLYILGLVMNAQNANYCINAACFRHQWMNGQWASEAYTMVNSRVFVRMYRNVYHSKINHQNWSSHTNLDTNKKETCKYSIYIYIFFIRSLVRSFYYREPVLPWFYLLFV